MPVVPEFSHFNLVLDDSGLFATLSFNHGKANEMGSEQVAEIESLCAWLECSEIVALLSTSTKKSSRGTPIFIAGANVTERIDWSDDRVKRHVRWQRRILERLRNVPQFHIGIASGVALGWGVEYLLNCDYRIACEGAVFGLPETGLGILPGAGGTSELWAHVGRAHALRLGMTGEKIGPDEALRIGLVQELSHSYDEAVTRAQELARMVGNRSPTATALFKGSLISCLGMTQEHRRENEAKAYEACVESGQAAIGRASFKKIRNGERPEWGRRAVRKDK